VREAYAAGVSDFGETQEALGKQAELADLPLSWHFIGPIRSTRLARSPRTSLGCIPWIA
jgi:uncharacterized pyridoxal phosphate-containing UPF0001 family protein